MTLIIKKFDYAEIKRKQVDGKRLYACPDGNAYTSTDETLNGILPLLSFGRDRWNSSLIGATKMMSIINR